MGRLTRKCDVLGSITLGSEGNFFGSAKPGTPQTFLSTGKHVNYTSVSKTAFTTLFIYASAIVLERAEDRDVRGEEGVVRDIFGVHVPACRKLVPQLLTPLLLVELVTPILP